MAGESNVIIEVDEVSKRYGRTLALNGIDLTVGAGELFALLGPNGAGKTTLIDILCTIHPPDEGTAKVAGYDVVREPLQARQNIGVVFQDSTLDDRLTVYENLEFHGRIYGVPRKLRRERIRYLLDVVELSEWRDHVARALSSGMKRRLEIARALVHDSRILFLDEPTVGLDAQSREGVWKHVAQLQKDRDLTVLVTTHYIGEVETCDRVCIIDHGTILADDTPDSLKDHYGQERLRVRPRAEEDARAILDQYADVASQENGELVIDQSDDEFVERFLALYGGRIRSLNVETPSLESVFLALTGRGLRDKPASDRERTQAFGKRGGEHTR